MPFDRRLMLKAGATIGVLAPALASGAAAQGARRMQSPPSGHVAAGTELGLVPNALHDQSRALQQAIDQAAERGVALALAPGRYLAQGLRLRAHSWITGVPGKSVLSQAAPGPLLSVEAANDCRIENLVLEGVHPITATGEAGLLMLQRVRGVVLSGVDIRGSRASGMVLRQVSGSVRDCSVAAAALAGIFSIDAEGLEIVHNTIFDCANNGILVWSEKAGEDGTHIASNRIQRIRAVNGGTGENGNGINIYRAGNVLVTGNHITDCAYTAVRGNSASNLQIVANQCLRLGEVALYAEFAFEGAVISSNLVDGAATGISVTNFNEGGRLAVVQGNLIRNLMRREHEPVDKRGDGICVEADTAVSGNVVENAPNAGILIGWGPYMRDVSVTSNIIRRARVGVMITRDPGAGAALVAQNLISGARDGAIRTMNKGEAVGTELARQEVPPGRVTVVGNHVAEE